MQGAEEQHAAIIILHFKLPVLPFETATIQSDSSSAASRPASPSQVYNLLCSPLPALPGWFGGCTYIATWSLDQFPQAEY